MLTYGRGLRRRARIRLWGRFRFWLWDRVRLWSRFWLWFGFFFWLWLWFWLRFGFRLWLWFWSNLRNQCYRIRISTSAFRN